MGSPKAKLLDSATFYKIGKSMPTDFAENEARYLLRQIEQHANAAHRRRHSMSAPTAFEVHGVTVPNLRKIAKTWYLAHKDITQADFEALIEAQWQGESREEHSLAVLLLEHYADRVPHLSRAHFDRWRQCLDSWESTDGLAWALALWLAGDPDTRLAYLWDLVADDNVWSRRLALVPLARINRGQLSFTAPDLTFALIDHVKTDHHPMMTKAVSWVLRETTRTHPDRVATYLNDNQTVLAGHIVREVNNKLRTGLKSGKEKVS